ncbi:MAG: GNAT family N-acetyltransferase [Acutalibacter sp.]|nr:GNAT family N-acetyltransferase [Acutalibacter sp.]
MKMVAIMNIQLLLIKTDEQIAALCKIAERVWHLTYDPLLPAGQVEYMLDKFQSPHAVKEQMETLNYRYYMAVIDGKNAGFIGFSPRYEGREEMFLSKVYLLPEFRGQGAVREMFALVERETRRENLSKIRLTVNKENTHAVAVYEHYGFCTAEKAVTDIGGGYVMDDFIMVKELE